MLNLALELSLIVRRLVRVKTGEQVGSRDDDSRVNVRGM